MLKTELSESKAVLPVLSEGEQAFEPALEGAVASRVRWSWAAGDRHTAPPGWARLSQGRGVMVSSVDELLTTGQAASMLGVSRTYVCKLLDEEKLGFEYRGTHRRVRTSDLLEYLRAQRARRREALEEVQRLSHEAGLYADEF